MRGINKLNYPSVEVNENYQASRMEDNGQSSLLKRYE